MTDSDHNPNAPESPLPIDQITACPLCGAARLQPAGFAYLFASLTFPGVRCAECGFVCLSHRPTVEGLARLYDSSYFDSDYHCGHEEQSYFANEEEQTGAATRMLAMIEAEKKPGKLLEVGCAGGFFLQAARQRGWSPLGVEISADAAAFARAELGLEVLTGTLESVSIDAESIDAVYMGDVLEHVGAPLDTIRIVWRLLRPGGVLVIAGPTTINSLDRRLGLSIYRALGRTKVLQQAPYHLSEFTPGTLRQALVTGGFAVRWIRQDKIPPTPGNPAGRPVAEHVLKLVCDLANRVITRSTGRLGDRAIALAVKP